jgi:hypothetical protein
MQSINVSRNASNELLAPATERTCTVFQNAVSFSLTTETRVCRRLPFLERDEIDGKHTVSDSLHDVKSGNQYHYNFTKKNFIGVIQGDVK